MSVKSKEPVDKTMASIDRVRARRRGMADAVQEALTKETVGDPECRGSENIEKKQGAMYAADGLDQEQQTHLLGKLEAAAKRFRMLPEEFLDSALGEHEHLTVTVQPKAITTIEVRVRPDPELDTLIQVAANGRQVSDWIATTVVTAMGREKLGFAPKKLPRSKVSVTDKNDYSIRIPVDTLQMIDGIREKFGLSRASFVQQILMHELCENNMGPESTPSPIR